MAAMQAILAAQRRKREEAEKAAELGDGGVTDYHATLVKLLVQHQGKLAQVFEAWDSDGTGVIDRKEFRSVLLMMGLKPTTHDLEEFFKVADADNSGDISLEELVELMKEHEVQKVKPPPKNLAVRFLYALYDFINTTGAQTVLYLIFVVIFQLLTDTLRIKEEFYLDKMISDTLIDNHFDSSHNTFLSIRRPADIWEWGNTVLWPGLMGNAGPACGLVGIAGNFRSSYGWGTTDLSSIKSGCNDDVWPDGDGDPFNWVGATPWTVHEQVDRFNQLDWSEGIMLQTVRVASRTASQCDTHAFSDRCYPETGQGYTYTQNTTGYGYNWTHPTSPLSQPFKHWTPEQLGTATEGIKSAHRGSFQSIPAGGFAAFVIPFFSDTLLAEERGTSAQITDFNTVRVTKDNSRDPNYFCVRLSWNGEWIHQLCDPNVGSSPGGRTTGVVRAAIEEFWNDLKRAHFLDMQSRAFVITIPISTVHIGSRSRVSLIMETTSTGAVLTSVRWPATPQPLAALAPTTSGLQHQPAHSDC